MRSVAMWECIARCARCACRFFTLAYGQRETCRDFHCMKTT